MATILQDAYFYPTDAAAKAEASRCSSRKDNLPTLEELEELISQGSDATSTRNGTEEALKKMQEKENSLVLWLACLAKR